MTIKALEPCLCVFDSIPIKRIGLFKIERMAKQDELEAKIKRIRSLLKVENKIKTFNQ